MSPSGATARARTAWLTRCIIGEYRSSRAAYSAGFLLALVSLHVRDFGPVYIPFTILVEFGDVHGINIITHGLIELGIGK